MIFLPPRAGKSLIVSKNGPAFVLGKHPEWDVVTTTYGQELADDFGRSVRAVLNDPLYHQIFPLTKVAGGSNAADRMDTTARGSYRAVGRGGSLTGRGAHVLIVDDPLKDRQEADSETVRESLWKWYSSTARTRLAPGGGIILCQTRWHEDDLAGRLILQAQSDPSADQWCVYKYPALAIEKEYDRAGRLRRSPGEALHPARFDEKELGKLKASLTRGVDAREWQALYQQNPVPADGNFFRRLDLQTYTTPDIPSECYRYISTDFAVSTKQTADWTVFTPFGVDHAGNMHFTRDCYRDKVDSLTAIEKLLDLVKKHKPLSVFIETGPISNAIMPMLQKRMKERGIFVPIVERRPDKDKMARATPLQALTQQKMVFFPDTPFFADSLIPEFLAFPAGKNDDIVDACSWGAWLISKNIIVPRKNESLIDESVVQDSYEAMRKRCLAPGHDRSNKSLFAHLPQRKKVSSEDKWTLKSP